MKKYQVSPATIIMYDDETMVRLWFIVYTAQQSVQPTLLTLCPHCERVHDNRVACPEYVAKSQSG